jgi:hypothetical protein
VSSRVEIAVINQKKRMWGRSAERGQSLCFVFAGNALAGSTKAI